MGRGWWQGDRQTHLAGTYFFFFFIQLLTLDATAEMRVAIPQIRGSGLPSRPPRHRCHATTALQKGGRRRCVSQHKKGTFYHLSLYMRYNSFSVFFLLHLSNTIIHDINVHFFGCGDVATLLKVAGLTHAKIPTRNARPFCSWPKTPTRTAFPRFSLLSPFFPSS